MPNVAHYLDIRHLRQLDGYSYRSVDKSPISNHVMRHWWTWSSHFMPIWLAPNLITTLGFLVVLVNVITVYFTVPDLVGPASSWVYLSCAIGLFTYQTMDNIDGKQARRTGTSSPLGELFDHGIDTLNCPLGGLVQATAMGLGNSGYSLFCILVACWSMYLSTWEEYHTGILYLGFFNGPVEGVLMAVSVLVISTFWGPGWWSQPLSSLNIPFTSPSPSTKILDLMMLFVLLAFLICHLPLCLLNVYRAISRPPRELSAPPVRPVATPLEAFSQLFPIVLFSTLVALWLLSPRSTLLNENHLIEFTVLICCLFGQLSSKVILAQLTRGVYPFSPFLMLPLGVGVVLVNCPLWRLSARTELYYLHFSLLISAISYGTTSTRVVTGFCEYLDISCFTIPYPGRNVTTIDMGGRQRSATGEWERGNSLSRGRRKASVST